MVPHRTSWLQSRLARASIVLEVGLGIGALGGGATLMLGRHGEILHMPLSILAGSPFADFFIPGLILFSVLGIGPLVVAVLTLRAHPWAPLLTIAVGGALLIWLFVEISIIGYADNPPVQLLYLVLGTLVAIVGVAWAVVSASDVRESFSSAPRPRQRGA